MSSDDDTVGGGDSLSAKEYRRRLLDRVNLSELLVIRGGARARQELDIAGVPAELAERFPPPWLRVKCTSDRLGVTEPCPCDEEWWIGLGPKGPICRIDRDLLAENTHPLPAWQCPRGCNALDYGRGMPWDPALVNAVEGALAEFLGSSRRGRPRSPAQLDRLREAISDVRARGGPITLEEVAAHVRRPGKHEGVDPRTVRRWLGGENLTWDEFRIRHQ